ncbi:MAG: hypothetical protein JO117_03200 [Verrucomicrobia bacterium]|nr:hypothetical protein [Verrucomicrobiota bacterium]MBV9658556.1 hypothetical protein [Verrucomicrobiota bacterium]
MPATSYPPVYPQQAYAPPPPQRSGGGCGCWLKGCFALFVVFLLLGGIGTVTVYYAAKKIRDQLTTDHPVTVRTYPATDAEWAALEPRLRAFSRALNNQQRAALELSADDLNVLVAKSPDFAWLRGKVFFTIDGDILGMETSLPLGDVPTVGRFLQGRYFNGKASGELTIHRGDIRVVPHTLEANGQRVGPDAMKGYAGRINSELEESIRRNPKQQEELQKIETLDVSDGKVRIVSRGKEP